MKNKTTIISVLFNLLSVFFCPSLAQDSSDLRWFPRLAPNEYVNPVITGFFPDPSVVRVGEDYYCVNSTFEYFPGIIISHSKDLIHWKQIGHVFSNTDSLDLTKFWDGMGIWAPDISYYNGEFYVFYCTVQLKKDRSYNVRGNYMVKSKSINGPWSKPVQLTDNGNDPSHFVDENGDHYMLFAAGIPQGNGTKIVKLNKECTKVVEGPFWIETEGKKAAPEGPHLIKKDGYYYLTMAASGGLFNGHHMLVARSKNIYGPYVNSPYNPSLTQKNVEAINFHQGHGKLFHTQFNEWFTMVISQRRIPGDMKGVTSAKAFSPLGRETSLIRLEWTPDGWPKDKPSRKPLDIDTKPNLPEHLVVNKSSDEFEAASLSLPWQYRRNPLYSHLSLTEKKGVLRIYTSDHDIDTLLGRNLIVQRERWLKYTATTKLSFLPQSKEQAGITCYYDTKTYARLGLQRDNAGKLQLVLEEMNRGVSSINTITPVVQKANIFLRVKVDKLRREFYYSYDNKTWTLAGTIANAAYLSDQGTPNWGFMGTMVGVYAFNRGTAKRIPADFDWFRIDNFAQQTVSKQPNKVQFSEMTRLDQFGGPSSGTYLPTETEKQRIAWFRDAKFGMFMHWGLYSAMAGYWKGEKVTGGEWAIKMHKLPIEEYRQLAKSFNPIKFNADEWVSLIKAAGMKYLVITAKHHDGFAMFQSSASAYNIVDATPFKRDPMKELKAACDRHGIRFGLYYSHAQDWNEPDAYGNDWSFNGYRGNMDKYLEQKAYPQIREICEQYRPDIIWYDTPGEMNMERAQKVAGISRTILPNTLINSRIFSTNEPGLWDYKSSGDNDGFVQYHNVPWELCGTLNRSWAFKKWDTAFRPVSELLYHLIDAVSKNGNYLLNVGPTAEGEITAPYAERLRVLGDWLKRNGEAVYGCNGTAFGTEFGDYALVEGKRSFVASPVIWRCTTKPGKLYIHVFNLPDNGKIVLPAIKGKIKKAYLLANKNMRITTSQSEDGIAVDLPKKGMDPLATVICLEL